LARLVARLHRWSHASRGELDLRSDDGRGHHEQARLFNQNVLFSDCALERLPVFPQPAYRHPFHEVAFSRHSGLHETGAIFKASASAYRLSFADRERLEIERAHEMPMSQRKPCNTPLPAPKLGLELRNALGGSAFSLGRRGALSLGRGRHQGLPKSV
jgi:hypothetical protein